jgi:carboxymethylenebutenolidase
MTVPTASLTINRIFMTFSVMKRSTLIVLVYGLVALIVPGLVFAQTDPAGPAETNVTYAADDGVELSGYLATPAGSGPHPAVLMIHEWWGLNHDTAILADALAREGYVVLAPDAFRGSLARTSEQAMAQLRSTPREQIASDLDAALDFLMNHPAVDSDRVASMGFCFGGTQSMYLGTRADGLAAVVTFYGSGPIQNASELGKMSQNGPVLGIFGEEDRSIPVSEVRGFENALRRAGIDNEIEVYAGVGHAFVKSDTYNRGGAPEQAWNRLVAFLDREVK